MAGFSVLPSDMLPADGEIDLQTLVDQQDALAVEARQVLPYTFDVCTFSLGPLRQSIFSCRDCGERGVCYGCSISCHAEHRLVELWTKRDFTCDCPTESMCCLGASSSSSSSTLQPTRRCTLNPAEEQPYPTNETNRYTHNFAGEFCRCGRDYDPITEPEAMVHCIACEDWFHESCLNLQSRRTVFADDDEDEEAACLIPSDTYDCLVCAACVDLSPFIAEKRGTEGWMVIVPDGEGWRVVGRIEEVNGSDGCNGVEEGETGTKRPRADETSSEAKRARVDEETARSISVAAGDVFIALGIRDRLAAELAADIAASLPFPLVDAEIYEPAEDTEEEETLEQVTERAVSSLPRFQAIEAVHGFHAMKDKLKVMLSAHAEAGSAVSRQDIEEFFSDLRRKD